MTEKRFKPKRHCKDGKCHNLILDKSNYRFVLMLSSWEDCKDVTDVLNELADENEQLKQLIKELEKQIYLIHMSSMFSTVKSFKGDVSKRYKYSEETDTIYDTANNYGQYDKVLDKKEIVMLLNEYETVLNELKGDVE